MSACTFEMDRLPFGKDKDSSPEDSGLVEKATEPIIIDESGDVVSLGNTSLETPAPMGTWVSYKVKDYSAETLFNAELRITDVVKESEDSYYVNEVLKEYNDSHYLKIDVSDMSSKIELVVADIDVRIPSTEDVEGYYGYPLPLSFGIDKPDGVSYKDKDGDSVIFTTSVYELDDTDEVYSAGDVTHTKVIYAMVKGFDNYCIEICQNSDYDGSDFDYGYLSIK